MYLFNIFNKIKTSLFPATGFPIFLIDEQRKEYNDNIANTAIRQNC